MQISRVESCATELQNAGQHCQLLRPRMEFGWHSEANDWHGLQAQASLLCFNLLAQVWRLFNSGMGSLPAVIRQQW